MDPGTLKSFYARAESGLAVIRRALLVFLQDQESSVDLAGPIRDLDSLSTSATEAGVTGFDELATLCRRTLEGLRQELQEKKDSGARTALDLVAQMEASLLDAPLSEPDFFTEVSDLVDESFGRLVSQPAEKASTAEEPDFEIDDETLEIFRSEADELLANIRNSLALLAADPANHDALWEIRRNAHTFKGAAGIVGLRPASSLAHRVEDLLDRLSERRSAIEPSLVELLGMAADHLDTMSSGTLTNELQAAVRSLYAGFDRVLVTAANVQSDDLRSSAPTFADPVKTVDTDHSGERIVPVKPPPTPVVRVSLDRLDELLKLSRNLQINRSALAERFAEYSALAAGAQDAVGLKTKLDTLFEAHRRLAGEMLDRLLQIRMVRFGTLATRLNRAVHVTCQEENKQAILTIENEDIEVDTLVIDALVEPLLHLLRNAVVHGIENAETRRLIGKPEKGAIMLRVNTDNEHLQLSVADDGRGISATKLIEKAVQSSFITPEAASSMNENDVFSLIFERGLTTADSLNMNAGRGIGMSIVRESIESRGGLVTVASEPQRGTTFTITLPLNLTIPVSAAIDTAPQIALDMLAPLVLIVDDSASIRRQTSKMIESAGLRSITAGDGAEALELLLSGQWEPDLILSDVEMPQIDGWEFLEYVKTDDNFGQIPVVMVTSLDADEHRQKAADLGAADYIVKPICLADLESLVERYCSPVAA